MHCGSAREPKHAGPAGVAPIRQAGPTASIGSNARLADVQRRNGRGSAAGYRIVVNLTSGGAARSASGS